MKTFFITSNLVKGICLQTENAQIDWNAPDIRSQIKELSQQNQESYIQTYALNIKYDLSMMNWDSHHHSWRVMWKEPGNIGYSYKHYYPVVYLGMPNILEKIKQSHTDAVEFENSKVDIAVAVNRRDHAVAVDWMKRFITRVDVNFQDWKMLFRRLLASDAFRSMAMMKKATATFRAYMPAEVKSMIMVQTVNRNVMEDVLFLRSVLRAVASPFFVPDYLQSLFAVLDDIIAFSLLLGKLMNT